MNTNAEKIRFLMDNGLTIKRIAEECRVTQFHINETLQGRRKGGSFVTQRLDVLVDEMQESIQYLSEDKE